MKQGNHIARWGITMLKLAIGMFVVILALVACSSPTEPTARPSSTVTSPTPTPVPPTGQTPEDADPVYLYPPSPVFAVTVDPSEPKVGEAVLVTVVMTGSGGIPQYHLRIDPPLFIFESDRTVSVNMLGTKVSWNLRTTAQGTATLKVDTNYEHEVCIVDSHCFFAFTTASSDPIMVTVLASDR